MLRVVCVKQLRQIINHSCLCVNLSFLTFKKHQFCRKIAVPPVCYVKQRCVVCLCKTTRSLKCALLANI